MSPVDSIITLVAFLIAFALLLMVFVWCVKLEDTNSGSFANNCGPR